MSEIDALWSKVEVGLKTMPAGLLGIETRPVLAKGENSSVYRVGPWAVKVYDQPGSQGLSLWGLEAYQETTRRVQSWIKQYGQLEGYRIGVNPIQWVGMMAFDEGKFPFSVSPWAQGEKLSELIVCDEVVGGKIRNDLRGLARRIGDSTNERVGFAPTNVRVLPGNEKEVRILITDVRNRVMPRSWLGLRGFAG